MVTCICVAVAAVLKVHVAVDCGDDGLRVFRLLPRPGPAHAGTIADGQAVDLGSGMHFDEGARHVGRQRHRWSTDLQ